MALPNGICADSNVVLNNALSRYSGQLKIGHLNAGGMSPRVSSVKIDNVKRILNGNLLDIVGVSETWFKSSISNKSVGMDGYRIFRTDRPRRNGGGVCIFISHKIDAKCKVVLSGTEGVVDFIFLEVTVNNSKILIGVVYRPPNSGAISTFEDTISDISSRYERIVLMGDFNLDLLKPDLRNTSHSFWHSYNLSMIHNDSPTHFDTFHGTTSLLDYFLISQSEEVISKGQFWIPNISKHAFIYIALGFSVANIQREFFSYDFDSANIPQLLADSSTIDFGAIYATNDVNCQAEFLKLTINELFNTHIPRRRHIVRKNGRINILESRPINEARMLARLAFRSYTEDRTTERWQIYCGYRNRLTQLIRSAKADYGNRHFRHDQPNKILWQKIRNLGVLGDSEDCFGEISPDDFCRFFTAIQQGDPTIRTDQHIPENFNSFSFRCVTETELHDAIFSITSNAVGPDNIYLRFVKMIWPVFIRHILHVVNTVLMTSIFPKEWKCAKIRPIAKVSRPALVSDFRPISILSCLSKVCEVLIRDQMLVAITQSGGLYEGQSGFRRHHSTTTAILQLTEALRLNMDQNKVSFLIQLDFTKAFDSIDHAILCTKLRDRFSFSKTATNLLFSYLCDRQLSVALGDRISDISIVNRGVPQGSILGPLIFCMYVDDLPRLITNMSPHMYADDLQLVSCSMNSDMNLYQCIHNINIDLLAIHRWSVENSLILNPLKSLAMVVRGNRQINLEPISFKLGDHDIPTVEKLKSLGFTLNSRLQFDDHVETVCIKVFNCLRRLYSVNQYTPLSLRKKLFMSLIMPHFLYGCEIYSGTSALSHRKLQLCFNACVRYVYARGRFDHISDIRDSLLGCPLDVFFNFRLALTMFKLIHTGMPGYLFRFLNFSVSNRTRHLLIPVHSTMHMQRSFIVRSARIWNTIPLDIRESNSISLFRRKCKLFLGIQF